MRIVFGMLTAMTITTLVACSGGGGGGSASPSTGGGGGGGGNNGGDGNYSGPTAAAYVGYTFSATQTPQLVKGAASDFNTNRTLLGEKALFDLKDAGTYHMSVMVGDSECVTDAPNGSLFNKTYSMTMVRAVNNNNNDPTWAVVTLGSAVVSGFNQDVVSFSALKATANPGTLVVTTNATNTGTDGGAVIPHIDLADTLGWTCVDGVATYELPGGATWEFMANDSVMVAKSPEGSIYLGFSNNVAVTDKTELVGKSMEQYSFLFAQADDYNNCPSGCTFRANSNWFGAQSGVMYSGSPVTATMPQVGDQSPTVVDVSLSTASTTLGTADYAPAAAATAKFSWLKGTGDMMGSGPGHAGLILGISAKIGTQYVTVFTHQHSQSQHSNAINNKLGALILSVTP